MWTEHASRKGLGGHERAIHLQRPLGNGSGSAAFASLESPRFSALRNGRDSRDRRRCLSVASDHIRTPGHPLGRFQRFYPTHTLIRLVSLALRLTVAARHTSHKTRTRSPKITQGASLCHRSSSLSERDWYTLRGRSERATREG